MLCNNREYLWLALRLSICRIAVNALYFALTYCFESIGYNYGMSMLIFGVN